MLSGLILPNYFSDHSLSITWCINQSSYNFTNMSNFFLLLLTSQAIPSSGILPSFNSPNCGSACISFHSSTQIHPESQRHRRCNSKHNSHGPALVVLAFLWDFHPLKQQVFLHWRQSWIIPEMLVFWASHAELTSLLPSILTQCFGSVTFYLLGILVSNTFPCEMANFHQQLFSIYHRTPHRSWPRLCSKDAP